MSAVPHILAATDFSLVARSALREARRIANARGARLTVVHVMPEELLGYVGLAGIPSPQLLISGTRERWQSEERSVLGAADSGTEVAVLVGNVSVAISEFLDREGGDLVVFGCRGSGGNVSGRVGSCVSRCVRCLPCPVLITRGTGGESLRKVAALVDFSDASLEAVRVALKIAKEEGAALEVVHVEPKFSHLVTHMGTLLMSQSAPSGEEQDQESHETMEAFLKPLQTALRERECSLRILPGFPVAQTLSEYLRESRVDVAVVGSQSRSKLRVAFLGSTAEALMHDAPCSVLVVKPKV